MRNKKQTKRQIQAEETRNKIYNIAIDLMYKKGYDNITIEEISKKAGVSVGAFYHYFRSKNDIFLNNSEKSLLTSPVKQHSGLNIIFYF